MTPTVAWGILGFARIARLSAIPALQRAGNARLHGIASRDANKLAECKAQFEVEQRYSRYEDLLADPLIQAVYIPLPNSMHKQWTVAALRAGKHVLCEKPLALNATEAREMAAVARDTGRLLMEGFMYRYTDRTRKVRAVLESGQLGRIKSVNASFRFLLDRPNTIKMRAELGGGALYDIGCYPVNFVGMIAGRKPTRCHAVAESDQGVDTNLSAVLQYDDGMIANIHCSFNTHALMRAEIIGSEGILEVSDTFLDAPGGIQLTTGGGTMHIPVDESDRFGAEFHDFSDAILQGQPPLLSLDETLLNMEVLDMIRVSLSASR
jgi:predicted dehydrogenase